MLNLFLQLVKRDVLLAFRRRTDVLSSVAFFAIVCSLFPLGVGPEAEQLRMVAPGVLWVAALLASTLALNRLFSLDYADGTLEQLLLASQPLVLVAAAKIVAHWLICGLPLVLMAPLLALQFGLDGSATLILVASLLLGTPVLSLLGAVGAALTLDTRGGGVLIALLVLPLYVPVLIFGAGASGAEAGSALVEGNLLLLGAVLVAALPLAPWATAAALKISME